MPDVTTTVSVPDQPAPGPASSPTSGFKSSEFIGLAITQLAGLWGVISGLLPPREALLVATVGVTVYGVARVALKAAHVLGYAKQVPDLPDLPPIAASGIPSASATIEAAK